MEEKSKKGLTLFTKISIVINTLLFGITGILYLINKENVIGILLLAAGAMNIIYSLITVQTKNLFFSFLNFLFALVSLIVCIDFLLQKGNFMAMVWMIITLYYLITGFVLYIKVKNIKAAKQK